MKKSVGVAVVLLLATLLLYFYIGSKTTNPETGQPPFQTASAPKSNTSPAKPPPDTSSSPAAGTTSNPLAPAPSQAASPSLAASAGEVPPPAAPPANMPGDIALQNVRRAVRQYGEMFGGNPVGTNPEITSQLNGNNPKHINFINVEAGMRINENGELIDVWGTPYFFHQISGSVMELHSAGPDKVMWTPDDLVFR